VYPDDAHHRRPFQRAAACFQREVGAGSAGFRVKLIGELDLLVWRHVDAERIVQQDRVQLGSSRSGSGAS
jgi:hypothetical protein